MTNTDDFTSGLKRIVDDLDHYYLLGFYPIDTKGKGYRSLDVTVAGHPDWKLRFRRGYMPGGPPAAPKSADPLVALSTGILPKSDLPLRLSAIADARRRRDDQAGARARGDRAAAARSRKRTARSATRSSTKC